MKLRNKLPKFRVKAKLRAGRQPAIAANENWAMRCPIGECLHSP